MGAVLLDFVRNSVWHAFTTLSDSGTAFSPKSKLKVLVSHIGTVFECGNLASLALEDFGSDTSLNFKQFESYLSREVFSSLSDSLGRRDLSLLEKQIDQICWNLSKSKLILDSVKRNPRLGSESTFKLFRLFCLLGDLITDADTNNAQVVLCSEEAELVFKKLLSTLSGRECNLMLDENFECLFSNALFDFQNLLSVIELKFLKHFEPENVVEVINELYDEFVDDTVKTGTLMLKRYSTFGKYKEKMFVLKSSGIGYYNMDPGKMKFIEFDSQTRIDEDVGSEQASKFRKFRIVTLERVLNLATLDKRYRSQWIASLRLALSRLNCQESHGRYLKDKRRLEWHRVRIKREIETERSREMFEAEKMARLAAEDQAKELAQQKAYEEEQRKMLENMRLQLEKLLREEIQAKQDEELVRNLQAKILNEEWEKRDELEKLEREQRKLLDVERHKSKTYLQKQIELEFQLDEAHRKLKGLEKARAEMDYELISSRLKNVERNREILETRVKLFSAPIVEDEKIRRARRSVSMRESRPPPTHSSGGSSGSSRNNHRRLGVDDLITTNLSKINYFDPS
ncbi:switch-associated protein 70 [Folsomia candida]|uniref:Switch-associated protein 70 n=1 Tax=Folsomia candida TaxID=158441 RepID=A0A226F844_FOLCA|nr:switch-associated protein 70 [Folsomia candida]OXA65026.1 Switch-associated protein 70 [Folsomia candida]